MWKGRAWAVGPGGRVVRRKRLEKEQEELLAQIRLATHTKATTLYLLFTPFPNSGEKMLENSHLVINKVTGVLNSITESLLAMVNDRYTLIKFYYKDKERSFAYLSEVPL